MSPEQISAPPKKVSRRGLTIAGLIAALVVIVVVVNGIWSRNSSEARLKETTDTLAIPTVSLIVPSANGNKSNLDLPGRLEAYNRAPIYARVSGYVKSWTVDIGSSVKAGQTLAEVEAPDLDQQLLQARADLASQQASAKLSEATLNRRKTLIA